MKMIKKWKDIEMKILRNLAIGEENDKKKGKITPQIDPQLE